MVQFHCTSAELVLITVILRRGAGRLMLIFLPRRPTTERREARDKKGR